VPPPQRNATLNAFKILRNLYLCHFSQPPANRALYKLLRKRAVKSIVEIGLGRLERTARLIELAVQQTPADQLKYAGIDPFEGRAEGTPGLSLKEAHKLLKPCGIRVELVPGDPTSGLARRANALMRTDLLLISAEAGDLGTGWFYVPRMLRDGSQVFVEEAGEKGSHWRELTRLEIEQRAAAASKSMRRAA
jgi:hypothetical protein